MDLELLQQKAFELMGARKAHIEREIGGIYYHGQRCANVAVRLREHILPNDCTHDDILRAAGYFHDCAKGIEPHAQYGALIAKEAIKNLVNENELEAICDIIAKHADRKKENADNNQYVEIFQDADLIEHFGIYEIWMSFQYYAHTNGSILDAIRFYEENHVNHAAANRKLLNYDISRKIFDEKIEFENSFIERLKIEGHGGICYKF